MNTHGFVIHLARAEQRQPQVEALLEALPIRSDVIDAVDGRTLSEDEVQAVLRPAMHSPRYPFALSRGEIGCFLSHRKAWQAIVDGSFDAGLILEDDVQIDPASFTPVLNFALEHMQPDNYIRFPWRTTTDAGKAVVQAGGNSLVRPKSVALGTPCQLVGRDAASVLLEETRHFDRPVDTFIQMRWNHDVRVLAAQPVCLTNLGAVKGSTTLGDKPHRALGELLSREILRALYRARVKLRSVMS